MAAENARADWAWLEFPDTGGKQFFPPDSLPIWRAKGWVDTTPPVEPNPLKDPEPLLHEPPSDEPETDAPGDGELPYDDGLFVDSSVPTAGDDTIPQEG